MARENKGQMKARIAAKVKATGEARTRKAAIRSNTRAGGFSRGKSERQGWGGGTAKAGRTSRAGGGASG